MVHEWSPRPRTAQASHPSLTRSQKWDLVRMATAGIVTMAALGGGLWLITWQSQSGSMGEVTAAEPGREDPSIPRATVTVRTAEVIAPLVLERPALRSRPVPPVAPRARPLVASAAANRTDDSSSLPARLARFITGDGRHEVRPFPTVPDDER